MNSNHSEDSLILFEVLSRIKKLCPRCLTIRPMVDFPTRDAGKRKPNSYCKPCQRDYSKEHYRKNSVAHNQRRRVNTCRYAWRNRSLVREYLEKHPCVDCGEANPLVLEFDHVTDNKLGDVSTMAGQGFRWKRIADEMAKCEVRCANCHRRKTYQQFWQNSKIRTGGSSAW